MLCLVLIAGAGFARAQSVVPVGAGSYASFPPAEEGDGPANMQTRELFVVDSNALPIPTNDWWTDLIASRYAGDMWAYPLVVSANDQGARISFPTSFNAQGTTMQLGTALRLGGKVDPAPPTGMVVLADFESATYPPGWTTTGTAFGAGPAAGTLPNQSAVSGYAGQRLVNSFYGGDGPVGTLTSPAFTITHAYLHFLIAGGNHPGLTEVRLVVGGSAVRTATGDNSESLDWHTWDLSDLAGATARIEIVDQATGGWAHICADQFVLSDDPTNPGATFSTDFAPQDARALTWSDWLVRMRLADAAEHRMDVTFGHGLPFAWVECAGIEPRIRTTATARYFDDAGATVTFPATADRVGVEFDGRRFGIYAPAGSALNVAGDTLAVQFTTGDAYLAVAALTSDADLAGLAPYAYALPRETRFDWTLNRETSTVDTTWTVSAEALRGTSTAVLQGWLPHHYRTTTNDLAFSGPQYLTPRGQLKCAAGNTFSLSWPFHGVLPNLPAPAPLGVANDYDPARMRLYLTMYAGKTGYGGDTYWGGKDIEQLGLYLNFAAETGHAAAFVTLRATLRGALADWYTYTPGESEHYFAAYPHWGALVGFNESYYSFEFTDHHFHYGYFAMATALLGMHDPAFLADYGPMATLVAKEYANWDRADTRFPFLRTFDPWRGHSYAGGLSSPGGNNQESSSEAIQSWAGLFLLGSVLGDEDMAAAGAMGHAIETEAMLEYWQNMYGASGQSGTFSPAYPKTITGILFDSGQAYATYFSGDPAWIYGIQWLPISPAMYHLVRDPAFAAEQYDAMMAERDAWLAAETGEPNTFSGMGAALANVVLGYAQLFDPAWVAQQLDTLWTAEDQVARDNSTPGITYYFTHANRMLGAVQWNAHLDVPTSQVFFNGETGAHAYVAYNPADDFDLATVTSNGVALGRMLLPPHHLTQAASLLTPGGDFAVLDTWPADGAEGVPPALTRVAVVFSGPPAAASLSAATIVGEGANGLSFSHVADDLIAVFDIEGELQPGASYTVTLPAGVASAGGAPLGADHAVTFTVQPAEEAKAVLVAHYRLDEAAGTVAHDEGGSGFDGAYAGGPTLGLPGAAHASAGAVRFNGAAQQVELGAPEPLCTLTNDFTVSLWIYPETFGGNRTIFGARWHDYNGWSLRLVANRIVIERLGPTQVYDSGATVSANRWTHVAAAYDAQNDVTFYLDGVAVATIPGNAPAGVATEPWFIGNNGTNEGIVGRVDDVQLYRRALAADEVAFLHANPGRTILARAADLDGSGTLDLADLAAFTGCLSGPQAPADPLCAAADLDADGDVDLADVQRMQPSFR